MTDATDVIETETRERTHVDVVEETEEYDVCECHECGGVTPVEEAVAVGLGMEQTEQTATLEDVTLGVAAYHSTTTRSKMLTAREYLEAGEWYATVTVPQETLSYCAWCYSGVFERDVETALDAPAFEIHGAYDQDTEDGGGSPSMALDADWSLTDTFGIIAMTLLGCMVPAGLMGHELPALVFASLATIFWGGALLSGE